MQWGKAISQRVADIYLKEKCDVFVFRSRRVDTCFFATPRLNPVAMGLLLLEGEIVYFVRQPWKEEGKVEEV